MSDTDNPTDDPKDTGSDASDLKARLGLRTRKRRTGRPTGSSLGAGGDVAEARRRAEEASGSATSAEAFEAFPNDKTPLPQTLPGAGDDDEQLAGAGKVALKPLIVAMLVVAAVALFLGSVLGGSLEQQGLRDTHASYAKTKLQGMSGAKTKSGADLMPAILALQESLKVASKTLQTASVAKTGGEKMRVDALKAVFADIKAYADDDVFVDPRRLMDDTMVLYADDELLAAVKFAVKSRHLYDLARAAVGEVTAYEQMTYKRYIGDRKKRFVAEREKAGFKEETVKRTVLIRHTETEVAELGKLPTAAGSWILDTGKPIKVKLLDKGGKGKTGERWEMMVVEVGKTADDAVQVPTADVLSLDMTPEYESHFGVIQKLKYARLAAVVESMKSVSDTLDWADLEKKLQERAKDAK